MDVLSSFTVEFGSLDAGEYKIDFQVDDAFFAEFADSAIRRASVKVGVRMKREEDHLMFALRFDGSVHLTCDRCLGEFDLPVGFDKQLVVKIREEATESEDDEVVIIAATEQRFALANHVYDYLSLQVPYRKLHPDVNGVSGCDPEALKAIERHRTAGHRADDGRWDALKGIKLSPGGDSD